MRHRPFGIAARDRAAVPTPSLRSEERHSPGQALAENARMGLVFHFGAWRIWTMDNRHAASQLRLHTQLRQTVMRRSRSRL